MHDTKLPSFLAAALCSIIGVGCAKTTPRADADAGEPKPPPRVAPFPARAAAYTLETTLAVPRANTFAQLDPDEQRALARLRARSTLTTRVFAAGGRLLVIPPENHPAAGLELLLDAAAGHLDVSTAPGRIVRLPAAALMDVLDRALPSSRDLGEDPMHGRLPRREVTSSIRDNQLAERWQIVAPLRYGRRDLGVTWSLGLRVELESGPQVLRDAAQISPLCALIFSPLIGVPQLPALRICPRQVRRWQQELRNTDRESGAPARFETAVEQHGWQRLPPRRSRFQGRVSTAWRLAGPESDGVQLIDEAALKALRSGAATGALTVDNRSGAAALVYLDGALLGWVASGRQLAFSGVPHGFFNVFALAPSGVRTWGPRAIYVPGTLTLD